MKPIWTCSADEHGRDCQCYNKLKAQLKIWETKIVGDNPKLAKRLSPTSIWEYPIAPCPYCGNATECDMVDVGVGLTQCGPYHCDFCEASEVGPEGIEDLTSFESICGWYEPIRGPSPFANTFGGVHVDHVMAKWLYDRKMLDTKDI